MSQILKIFMTFLKIGAFSFGGGYAMIPFIEKEIVEKNSWLSLKEFIDIIAISQMTPGPIAINSSTFVGFKISKFWGAVAGTIGVILVSFILMTILASYLKNFSNSKAVKSIFMGIRPAVLGLIFSAAVSVGKTAIVDFKSLIIAFIVLFSILKFKLHPILCIAISGIIGLIVF
ncbi:chromate transporter [Caminicella sporogenes]|uniref:chromate transporter n=1 Tax=Caminicella sporogenes TaxID=166485 RepID=UPI00253FA58F|nr:chromate transporter [Caminicella sporogenes]WIF94126.1 chromate transporter [Caminicella sporogenes]